MPPSACSKRPTERCGRAGEGPFLVTEKLGFDELARDRGHVDGDERPLPPLAVVMKRARDEFFSRPGFTGDEDRQVGVHQPRRHPVYVLHGWRTADERQVLALCVSLHRGFCNLRLTQGAADHGDQFLKVEWFRQVFVRTALSGGDRRHERVLALMTMMGSSGLSFLIRGSDRRRSRRA